MPISHRGRSPWGGSWREMPWGLATLGGGLAWQPVPARVGLRALLVFHAGVAIAQLTNVLAGAAPWPVVGVHGVLAIAFGLSLRRP
ncbi:MAG: hypothetical protein HC918_00320 [Oscillatoriales cyanobacterium SM2_1_8]|nr:hypothetical protein [Oscillatoriales cyanobacterium SM2_1_8]